MARYTVTIQEILLAYVHCEGIHSPCMIGWEKLVSDYKDYFWNFTLPEQIPASVLLGFKERFLHHYFDREIGQETVELFKQRLHTLLYENAQKYMVIWNTFDRYEEFNYAFDWIERHTRLLEGNDGRRTTGAQTNIRAENMTEAAVTATDVNTVTDTFNRNVYTDTPDTLLEINANLNQLIEYASNINELLEQVNSNQYTNSRTDTTRETKSDHRLDYWSNSLGNHDSNSRFDGDGKRSGTSYATLRRKLEESYNTLIQIMIKDCSVLFMGVY
jgi:hypothetical protein